MADGGAAHREAGGCCPRGGSWPAAGGASALSFLPSPPSSPRSPLSLEGACRRGGPHGSVCCCCYVV